MKRMNWWWLVLAALMICPLGSSAEKEPPKPVKKVETFDVEEYDFYWTVAESGKAKVQINKDQDSTTVLLREGGMMGDYLQLTPKEAVMVGEAFTKTSEMYKKLKATLQEKDVQETVKAGTYRVSFYLSKKSGFTVHVRSSERFSITTVTLDRKQAKAFAAPLQKTPAMAKFVDKKLDF